MKQRKSIFMAISLLLLLLLQLLLLTACASPAELLVPEPMEPPPSRELAALYVHGESALLYAQADYAERELFPHLELYRDAEALFLWQETAGVNKGLPLWQIPDGEYSLRCGDDYLAAGEELYLPEGYSLTRNESNRHWQFFRDDRGLLGLRMETVSELPEQVYDLLIDPGHGGDDPGASGNGLVEAEENLRVALYLQELFSAMGLKVALSRDSAELPGGPEAEFNPYAPDARVDQVYRKEAKYLISCHLNAGGGSGFQLFSSLYTDTDWSAAVRGEMQLAGWHNDDNGLGLVAPGLYQRGSSQRTLVPRDYYFILRETGGYAISPYTYRMFRVDRHEELAVGAEALLVEYIFLDKQEDCAYWQSHWKELAAAVAKGSAAYWQLSAEPESEPDKQSGDGAEPSGEQQAAETFPTDKQSINK